jgi:alpha-D-xyloside xylohydrolase
MVEKWGENGFHSFSRSAYDKVRSLTTVWNGDAHANFTGLAYTVASAIRAGLIGFSHWTSDTGGYVRQANEPSEELWARWMHHSAFTPEYVLMMGTNHTPWYPPYTSRLLDIYKQTANLHHDLIPFIRSYTYQATQDGVPVIRALFLEHPDDPATYSVADEYFFGEQFLVAPFVAAGEKRNVYFPQGATYLEYFNKTQVRRGGTTAGVDLALEYIPVYVKAGAIVPRGDVVQANNKWAKHWAPSLNIELYPCFDVSTSRFDYYHPETKRSVPITMTTDRASSSVTITYGSLGFNGTLTLYTKGGPLTRALNARGGQAEFGSVETLF